MIKNEISLRQASIKDACGIAKLFTDNYPNGYHDLAFFSETKLAEKFRDTNKFLGVVALSDDFAVGFSGLHINILGETARIYLANFLVDKSMRQNGIGKKIEKFKIELCEKTFKKCVLYTQIHENKSAYTIPLKKSFGYSVWGVRPYFGAMEPGNISKGHLVMMGQAIGFQNTKNSIEKIGQVGETLIKSVRPDSQFIIPQKHAEFYGKADYGENAPHGQVFCQVTYDETGEKIATIIQKIKRDGYPYISFRIDAQSSHMSEADKQLVGNGFYPVAFLPYFLDGRDVIEYQYLENKDALSDFMPNKAAIGFKH